MLRINSYTSKGVKSASSVSLPKEWEGKENSALLAQAIHVYRDRGHVGFAKAQTRAEVDRTTRKLYKQKGTGGARHGSRKAPIFVGGGVAHGPRPVHRELGLATAMKRKATAVAISLAVDEKRVVACDLSFKKTSEVQKFLNKVFGEKAKRFTFIVAKSNKFVRNIEGVSVRVFPAVNAYDIYFGGNIILDKDIFGKEKKTK